MESAACIRTNNLLLELSSPNGNSSIETLLEEILAVLTAKYELHCRDKSLIFSVSEFFYFWDFIEIIRNNCFSIESSSTNVKFLIGTLVEELEPIVVEE